MKTVEEAAWLIEEFIAFKSHDQIDDQKRLRNILKLFESDIRVDERETRIKRLNSIGESKSDEDAYEYCRIHGLDIHTTIGNLFRIAGALMDARKDQDKITRHACAEAIKYIPEYESPNKLSLHSGLIIKDNAHQAIMNVNAIKKD